MKLATSEPGNPYEREADTVAEQVLRMPQPGLEHSRSCAGGCLRGQLEQPAREYEPASSGQPLHQHTRRFMESRFGHDFSQVRVHADSRAAESARSLNALAYTVGRHVVFGAGQFSPQSHAGRRLLAHELAHVVQQTTGLSTSSGLQRAPDQKPKLRHDVVLLGEGVVGGEELAKVLVRRGVVIPVKNVAEAAEVLGKIGYPIGTLYFVAHSTADGSLQFGKAEGFIKPADIATKLTGLVSADNAPSKVDFRGCSVGTSPKAMEQIRTALGAQSVVAGNCYAVITHSTPLKIGDKEITKASDVSEQNRPLFEKLFKGTADKLGVKGRCILNRSEKGFFAAGGRFVALFFNPALSKEWMPGKSVCYHEVTPQRVDPNKAASAAQGCSLIMVEQTKPEAKEAQPEAKETKP